MNFLWRVPQYILLFIAQLLFFFLCQIGVLHLCVDPSLTEFVHVELEYFPTFEGWVIAINLVK